MLSRWTIRFILYIENIRSDSVSINAMNIISICGTQYVMIHTDKWYADMLSSTTFSITGIITILNVEIHILIFLNPYMQTHPLNVCMIGFRV